jgi:hypothetical protein
MRQLFPFIDDLALERYYPNEPNACRSCGRHDVPLYRVRPTRANDSSEAACPGCLHAGRVAQVEPSDRLTTSVAEYARERFPSEPTAQAALARKLLDHLNQTPLGLAEQVQRLDWPLCCGDLTVFLGHPTPSRLFALGMPPFEPWDHGPGGSPFPDEPDLGELAVDYALFQCPACSARYFTEQHT